MKDVSESKLPVAPLGDADLEQVSGGSNTYLEASNIFNLVSSQMQSILLPFKDNLNKLENRIRYSEIIDTLKTYDNSKHSNEEKFKHFAESWNSHHSGQNMSPYIASLILGIEDEYDRAAVTCLPDTDKIITVLKEIYG